MTNDQKTCYCEPTYTSIYKIITGCDASYTNVRYWASVRIGQGILLEPWSWSWKLLK